MECVREMLFAWQTEYHQQQRAAQDAEPGIPTSRRSGRGLSMDVFFINKIHKLSTATRPASPASSPSSVLCPTQPEVGDATGSEPPPVKITAGKTVEPGCIAHDFPGTYPAMFLAEAAGVATCQPSAFAENWRKGVERLFAAQGASSELDEFMASGMSNGRSMSWCLMEVAAGQSFGLHAHANIEAIYVAAGCLHELAMVAPACPKPEPASCNDEAGHETLGPDLSNLSGPAIFERRRWEMGSLLVNLTGSVHQSFTEEECGAVLLVLWSGKCSLQNVPASRMPKIALEKDGNDNSLKILQLKAARMAEAQVQPAAPPKLQPLCLPQRSDCCVGAAAAYDNAVVPVKVSNKLGELALSTTVVTVVGVQASSATL